MAYSNEYISYSRVDLFRKCPKAFEFSYVQGLRGGGSDATRFGTACHAALEDYFNATSEDGGKVDAERLKGFFKAHFCDEGLTDQTLFEEGLNIMDRFAVAHGPTEPYQVKGCEVPFNLKLGRFRVKGYIDRVDDLGGGTIEVIDYKTNKQPYTTDELEGSMQLALYQWVARQMYPWAKRFVLSYWMLRMGYKQTTSRTDEQLERQMAYLETLAEATEKGPYPARLNALCGWCDHKGRCDAFKSAYAMDGTIDLSGEDGVSALVARREALAGVEKAAKGERESIDRQLKDVIAECGDIHARGKVVKAISRTTRTYSVDDVATLLSDRIGMPYKDVVGAVCKVEASSLRGVLRKEAVEKLGEIGALSLEAEVENSAQARVSTYVNVSNEKGW